MKKIILALGFPKKTQKQLQDIFIDELIVFEKTKKAVRNFIKKEWVSLILVYYKDDKMLDWVDFFKPFLKDTSIEIWMATEITSSYLLPAYSFGMDDFFSLDWENEIILAKYNHYLHKNKILETKKIKKIKLGGLVINPKKHKVLKKGKDLNLTRIEYELLNLLVSEKTKIFTRKEIYENIWGNKVIVGDRTLDVHMNNLRKKIGKNIITTKKGVGFGIHPDL